MGILCILLTRLEIWVFDLTILFHDEIKVYLKVNLTKSKTISSTLT